MKTGSAIIMAALIVFGLCRCGAAAGESGGEAAEGGSVTKAVVSQRTVVGEVDSIVGNEATLLIGELKGGAAALGEAPAEGASEDAAGQGRQPDAEESVPTTAADGKTPTENGEAPATNEAGGAWKRTAPSGDFAGGERPAGGTRGEGTPSGNFAGGGLTAGGAEGGSVEIEYTGETAVYDLPAGMAIGGGDFADVTEGMILRLTFSTYEDGTEAISSVEILSR